VRFNWPQYGVGTIACAAGWAVAACTPLPPAVRAIVAVGTAVAGFWLVASLIVSYVVYDRSPLSTWTWIRRRLLHEPGAWVNIHAGFDESTERLRALFPHGVGRAVDVYDPVEMDEPSIARARRAHPATGSVPGRFDALPLADGSVDTVFLLLAAHEIRRPESRRRFFAEVRRVLAPGGQVVLAEHVRDGWNFLAFGPGFVHFHARRTWLAAARDAGFERAGEGRVTPFVRTFTFRRVP
jgi:SAM-dependent methyltransferase